jgi:phosphatidylglycerophosphate synthase
MSKIKATYKSKDTEEYLDKIFYRPIGYVLALVAKAIHVTPNQVTIFSIFVGVAGGHMFYYNDLTLNIYGMLLLMFAQALDGADGQLARMTNSQSQLGRILDGLSDNLKFISIYIHLILRLVDGGTTPAIFFVALAAGISHSLQSALADYSRNHYVLYVLDNKKSEIDDSDLLLNKYKQLSWKNNLIQKFLMRVYINYTVEQEFLAKKMKRLRILVKEKFGNNIPEWFAEKYRELHKPLIKWYNILTSNTRIIVLFIGLFIGCPVIFWVFELTILNILMFYVITKHNKYSDYLSGMINKKPSEI